MFLLNFFLTHRQVSEILLVSLYLSMIIIFSTTLNRRVIRSAVTLGLAMIGFSSSPLITTLALSRTGTGEEGTGGGKFGYTGADGPRTLAFPRRKITSPALSCMCLCTVNPCDALNLR